MQDVSSDEKVVNLLSRIDESNPDVSIFTDLCKRYSELSRFDLARDAITRALEIEPDNLEFKISLANCYSDEGNYQKAEEIFAGYYDIQKKVGADEMKNIPYGAMAVWTAADKLAAGLQQLLAGARKFSLSEISRYDIFSANRETERETKVPFITDVDDNIAKKILRE